MKEDAFLFCCFPHGRDVEQEKKFLYTSDKCNIPTPDAPPTTEIYKRMHNRTRVRSKVYTLTRNPTSASTLNEMTSNWPLAVYLARDKVYWPTDWCIRDQYAPPVYLKKGPKQSVGFPQVPRSPFPKRRVTTHGKHAGGLEFFISRHKQDDIGL